MGRVRYVLEAMAVLALATALICAVALSIG